MKLKRVTDQSHAKINNVLLRLKAVDDAGLVGAVSVC